VSARPFKLHRAYVAARESMLAHARDCYWCKPPEHPSSGCSQGRRLYDATRAALRERNAAAQPREGG
jgi:hypothetical protein